jgi:hypothetical protein
VTPTIRRRAATPLGVRKKDLCSESVEPDGGSWAWGAVALEVSRAATLSSAAAVSGLEIGAASNGGARVRPKARTTSADAHLSQGFVFLTGFLPNADGNAGPRDFFLTVGQS